MYFKLTIAIAGTERLVIPSDEMQKWYVYFVALGKKVIYQRATLEQV